MKTETIKPAFTQTFENVMHAVQDQPLLGVAIIAAAYAVSYFVMSEPTGRKFRR